MADLSAAHSAESLEAWRIAYLGASGKIKAALAGLKDVPKQDKPAVGARLNTLRQSVEAAFEERKAALASTPAPAAQRVDVTEPGIISAQAVGRRHVISRVREELVEVFARMGFSVAEGPELEDDAHNFIKLNIPRAPRQRLLTISSTTRAASPRMMRFRPAPRRSGVMEAAVQRGGGRFASPSRSSPRQGLSPRHRRRHALLHVPPDRRPLRRSRRHHGRPQVHAPSLRSRYFGPEAQVRLRRVSFHSPSPAPSLT